MGVVQITLPMSLDGFITGPDDGMDHGLGAGDEPGPPGRSIPSTRGGARWAR